MINNLESFTDVLGDEICSSQPLSLPSTNEEVSINSSLNIRNTNVSERPVKGTGQCGQYRSTEEIDPKYRDVFSYPYFNQVQSDVIEDALYSDTSLVVCAPTGSGKTVIFEMAIVQLLMDLDDKQYNNDFKIIYMAPVKALCTERLTEWYPKFTKLGLNCIEVTGDTDVDFGQLKPYKIIITTPEKWDILTRRWRDHRSLVEVIKLFLIDEVHILNDGVRGPVLEAVVSRMKTIESSAQTTHRIEKLQKEIQGENVSNKHAPRIRFVAVSATVSNPGDVANWLGTCDKPAKFYKYGDECRPVKLNRVVEGYSCPAGSNMFKFDLFLNYRLWPIIQKYHAGKPTLIFCNTRKSVTLTAEVLCKELTIRFNDEQKTKLTALAASIKNKKLQALVANGVGCHHAGLLYEERQNIEMAFRNKDLPILITTTTLAMGVNLPAHLVIIKNTQQYVNGAYQEYSISTVLQMVGRAGRPQYDTEATAVIMTRLADKPRYQALLGGCEPLQSYLHMRLAENLNSEAALGSVGDVAQCVQWLRSTFLYVRALQDPKKYLSLPHNSPQQLISKKVEELCVRAMNGLATAGLITMDEASCIESTDAGRMMSLYYIDLVTMKNIMKVKGDETIEQLLLLVCDSHELSDMHLRIEERRTLNALNRNNAAATIRFPMKGRITTRQMKLNCVIQAVLGCLPIADPSLNQEAMKIMRIADRICKCLVAYVTRFDLISRQPQFYSAVLNSIILAKCIAAHLWENSPFMSKQMKGIGPAFSTLLATAGKVNFMLLAESHPRDLERLMNKGPPAGNVLRKQISLLPKYQLTMTPVDEKTVTLNLVLLNHAYLSENMDNLTAGANHKSFIVVGDSSNNLLLLASFKDKDLISIFDGNITHEVRRKHNTEHKIYAHCISSTFVGIDVQSEYTFNSLEPFFDGAPYEKPHKTPTNKPIEKQTHITDTYKERKRRTLLDSANTPKEKKKKDSTFINYFKSLQNTFGGDAKHLKTSYAINEIESSDYNKPMECIEIDPVENSDSLNNNKQIRDTNKLLTDNDTEVNIIFNRDESMDSENIESILVEIEREMSKDNIVQSNNIRNSFPELDRTLPKVNVDNLNYVNGQSHMKPSSNKKSISRNKYAKVTSTKSNYDFIDLLEKKVDSEEKHGKTISPKHTGFSEAIRGQIEKYLHNVHNKTKSTKNVELIISNTKELAEDENGDTNSITAINSYSSLPNQKFEMNTIINSNDMSHEDLKQNVLKPDKQLIHTVDISNTSNDLNLDKYLSVKSSSDDKVLDLRYDVREVDLKSPGENISFNSSNKYPIPIYNDNKCQSELNHNLQLAIRIEEMCDLKRYNSIIQTDLSLQEHDTHEKNEQIKYIITKTNNNKDLCEIKEYDLDNVNKGIIEPATCNKYNITERNNLITINMNNYDQHFFQKSYAEAKSLNVLSDVVQVKPLETKIDVNEGYEFSTENDSHTAVISLAKINKDIGNHNTICDHLSTQLSQSLIVNNTDGSYLNNDKKTNKGNTNIIQSIDKNNTGYDTPSNSSTSEDVLNYNKRKYINKCKYTATVIDVSDKEMPDCHVQVIKKIKLDWDITEIISPLTKNKRKHPRDAILNISDYGVTQRSNIATKGLEFEKYIEQAEQPMIKNIISKPICDLQFEMPNYVKCSPEISRPLKLSKTLDRKTIEIIPQISNETDYMTVSLRDNTLSNCEIIQPPRIIEDKSKDSYMQQNEVQPRECNKKDALTIKNKLQTVDITQDNETVYNKQEIFKRNEEDYKHVSDKPACKANTAVQNLLQKYITILGSNKDISDKQAQTQNRPQKKSITSTETSNITEGNTQPKRPFNITDLQRVNASLPKTILADEPVPEMNLVCPKIEQYARTSKSQMHFKNAVNTSNMNNIRTNIPPDYQQLSICTEDPFAYELQPLQESELAPTSINTVDEISPNYNLDHSMFDPKALLQCALDDHSDQFIPPPPQFCDNTYSPGYDDDEVNNIFDNYNAFEELNTENNSEPIGCFDESIFEDECPTTLTPSKEIETWSLSREDSWENSSISGELIPTRAFTVMRNNCSTTPNNYSLLRNNATSRRARLGKFKFNHKRKLIAKK